MQLPFHYGLMQDIPNLYCLLRPFQKSNEAIIQLHIVISLLLKYISTYIVKNSLLLFKSMTPLDLSQFHECATYSVLSLLKSNFNQSQCVQHISELAFVIFMCNFKGVEDLVNTVINLGSGNPTFQKSLQN